MHLWGRLRACLPNRPKPECLISSHSDWDIEYLAATACRSTVSIVINTDTTGSAVLRRMLRPNATRIVLTRDEIRHLRSREALPRYHYHDGLSIAQRSDGPALNPVANLHIARDLPFRTRPQGPRHAETSGSDETSSTQSTLPSSPGHDYEQGLETIVSFVGTQGTSRPPAVLREGRGLRGAPRQSPETSEDTSDPRNLSPSTRDAHSTPEEVAGSGPDMELPSSDAGAFLERKAQQDVGHPGVLQCRVSVGLADSVETAPWWRALHVQASLTPVSFSRTYRALGQPSCKSAAGSVTCKPPLADAARQKGPTDFDDPQTPTIRSHHGKGRPPVTIPHMASPGAGAAVASRDAYSIPHADMEPSAAVIPVYNDMLGSSSQPQTPPNPRHRGRLDEASIMVSGGPGFSAARQGAATLTGRRRRREGSPAGIQTPGFVGLFGGMENADGFASP